MMAKNKRYIEMLKWIWLVACFSALVISVACWLPSMVDSDMASVDDNLVSNEGICRWFTLEEISTLEMPFTAKYVMEHYCRTGYLTNALYVGIACPDKVYFSGLQEF